MQQVYCERKEGNKISTSKYRDKEAGNLYFGNHKQNSEKAGRREKSTKIKNQSKA